MTEVSRYKPGSRIQTVYSIFVTEGAAAAREKGKAMGLTESTLKNWIRKGDVWADDARGKPKEKTASDTNAEPSPRATATKKTKPEPVPYVRFSTVTTKGERVEMCSGKDPRPVYGTVITKGPQQSVVKWDNGNVRNVSNDWIRPIGETNVSDSVSGKKLKVKPVPTPRVEGGKRGRKGKRAKAGADA